jgi:hypothetical protein
MTAIAKYALVRDGRKIVLQNNLGAYDVLNLSVAGPDLTVRYLDAFHDTFGRAPDWGREPEGWDMDAEGGLLVDVDQRSVLAFTIYTDVAQRAAYFATVARAWPGWRVAWAYDGIADLMRHAGDGDLVDHSDRWADVDDLELGHYVQGRYGLARSLCRYLVTVTDAGGRVTAHSVTDPEPWWVGEPLLGALSKESLVQNCPTTPEAGLHLDVGTHAAWLWSCNRPLEGIRERWTQLWPGWTLTFCAGQYADQLDRCKGAIDVPLPSASDGYKSLRKGFEDYWQMFVPVYPGLPRGPGESDPIGRRLSMTREELDAAMSLIRPPSARAWSSTVW